MILRLNNLKIGRRLILGFAIILVLMLAGSSLLVWQFHLVDQQSDRVNRLAQELVAVSRFQNDILSMDAKLDSLAKAEDIDGFKYEAGHFRSVLVTDTDAVRSALTHLPPHVGRRAAVLSTVEAVAVTLPPQLDAVFALGAASDWNAVRLRLANEKKPLEAMASDLVRNAQQQVSDQLAESVNQSERVEGRVLLICPLTALLTFLTATLLGIAITRSITTPLEDLLRGSSALARGDFDHKVKSSGKDELGRLATAFNETTAKLQELYRELRRSETYLAEAQSLSHTGSFGWHISSGIMYWSDETFRIYEVNPANEPTLEMLLERTHPNDRRFLRQIIDSAVNARSEFDVEHRLLMPSGLVKFVRLLGHSNDRSGNFEIRGVVVDITDRKRSEEERDRLRQLEGDLAHINRVSMMGEMAASLAHEIKQPIAAAVISANSCVEWLEKEPPNIVRARAAANRVEKNGTRAAKIIDRIRSFYKKSPAQRELVDINDIIPEMLVLLRGEATRYSIAMRTELDAELPTIMADRVQLQQVFMNLMLNGIEAMEDSGGELTVKSQVRQDGRILISVTDTGVGFPVDQVDQIFSAFFTTKPQGSGMGLAISRSIIESHGGRLWATTNNGQGAAFHFTLPTQAGHLSPLLVFA